MVEVSSGEREKHSFSLLAGFCYSVIRVVLHFVFFFPTSRFHLLSFSKQDLKVENKC